MSRQDEWDQVLDLTKKTGCNDIVNIFARQHVFSEAMQNVSYLQRFVRDSFSKRKQPGIRAKLKKAISHIRMLKGYTVLPVITYIGD